MKIALTQTYFCNECQRHAYPDDVFFYRAEEASHWAQQQNDAIYVSYKCSCGLNWHDVIHVIDDNGELFPRYNIDRAKGLS